jgi:hypothetical protein
LELVWAGAVCVLALAVWIWFRLYTGIMIEDSFITYRYAQNIAQGNGFVYNVGEHVLGTTSPLFTLILALLGIVFGVQHIPTISVVLMIPAGMAAGWITFLALRKLNLLRWLPVFFLAAFLLNFNVLWAMTGGLETPLVLLLMAASFYMLVAERWIWAGVFAALLVLTRIDGIIWAAGVYTVILTQDRRAFLKSALIGALIVLPWVIFAYFYFGSPIPNTVAAKATIGQEDDFSSGYTMASYAGWWLLHIARISPFGRLIGFLFFGLGGWAIFKRYQAPALKLLFAFPFAFLIAYYAGHAPKFPWYLVPLIWAGMVVGAIGLWAAGRIFYESLPNGWQRPGIIRWGIVTFFAIYAVSLFTRVYNTAEFQRRWQLEENHGRVALGKWIRDHSAADASVAMEAIGYQGYFSQRRVIDLAGLISPEVVEQFRKTGSNAQVLYSIITTARPEFVVLREFEMTINQNFLGGPLFEDGDQRICFTDNYREAAHFRPLDSTIGRGLFNLVVYQRIVNG